MEESYETFEEELGPTRKDSLPQKPVRQIRQPEMYASRKFTEEMSTVPQPPKVEPKALPMEPTAPRKFPVQKTLSMQNLAQIETPWENVTLNRCLFVAISILVLTSGFQRLHETLRGQRIAEEEQEIELTGRQPNTLRHRGKPPQPETTLWEVLFWWLPDLDDDDEDDDKKRTKSGLRNKPMPDKKLMKQSKGTLEARRAKKVQKQKAKDKKEKEKDMLKTSDEADEQKVEKEEAVFDADMEKEKKKKSHKG
ncbi:uncharacterized protein LOC109507421 isoform X1 [Hippocampus comes]|uniref:uncharacterized protein LOC109507421 isoform X1 n=2 Tax=Hippocampus comes TaxID=109280 RepID=UPI00094E3851|nr:PREDICTED: uncharacterized protein LOC109507421 isoform X1 [Hippocampus comes]